MARHDDVNREIDAHLQEEIEEQIADGKSPDEARAAAMRALGNITLAKEQIHDLSAWSWWEQLLQDVRYCVRVFRRSPAFPVTAILTLALGVGANGAIFSVIDALLLRALPVSHPEALVVIRDRDNGNFSYPDYAGLRDANQTLTHLIATSSVMKVPVVAGADAEAVTAKIVSENYFSSLGVSASAGRVFEPPDETRPVAVISHEYWTRRFGRAPDVPGRAVVVRGVPVTIVGVAAAGFVGEAPGEAPDIWTSMALQRAALLNERGFSWLYLMGRVKPGVSVPQVQANLSNAFAALSPSGARPASRIDVSAGARGASPWRQRVGSPLWLLMVTVGLVLLIACTNLATLLLTRGAARRHEIAMRLAIGASRGRLVRQLMTEILLLAIAGGACSLVFALWGARILVELASAVGTGPELQLNLAWNVRLVAFTVLSSIAAGLLFGLLPSMREVRHAGLGLAQSQGRVVGSARTWSPGGLLIAIQVALSLILVAGSLMFVRTLRNLEGQHLGFRADGLLRVEVETERGYDPPLSVVSDLLERTAAIPGVQSVTGVGGGTLNSMGGVTGLQVEGYTPRDQQDRRARADWVGPGYFRTAGMSLVAGRDFSAADDSRRPRVTVVNQMAARYYFGSDAAALTRRLTWNGKDYEIVGVAENAKYSDLRERTPRVVYFPLLQTQSGLNALEVRLSNVDARALLPAIRRAVRDVDRRLYVGETLAVSERVDRKLGQERLVASLSSFFGTLTLLLVSLGIYATVAYSAGRRTKEFAVRLALGARRTGMIWLVLRSIMGLLLTGAAVGTAGAVGVGYLVRGVLFGVQPTDPLTFGSAAGLLIAVALVAGLLPAVRASRVDPAAVLRQ